MDFLTDRIIAINQIMEVFHIPSHEMHAMQILDSLSQFREVRSITVSDLQNTITHIALVLNILLPHIHAEYMTIYVKMVIFDLVRQMRERGNVYGGGDGGENDKIAEWLEDELDNVIAISLSIGRGVLYLSVLEQNEPGRPCAVVSADTGEHLAGATDVTGGEADGGGALAVSIAFA
jgi:hypothetical protein